MRVGVSRGIGFWKKSVQKTLKKQEAYQEFFKVFISDFRGLFQNPLVKVQPLGIFFQPKENLSGCSRTVDAVLHQH
jgi:hypothetical protein